MPPPKQKGTGKAREGGPPGDGDGSEYSYEYYSEEDRPPPPRRGVEETAESETATVDPSVQATPRDQREPLPRRRARGPAEPKTGGRPRAKAKTTPVKEEETPAADVKEEKTAEQDETASSSGGTSVLRELLQGQAQKKGADRNRPALSQVRLEIFKGSRSHYRDWRKTIEAQRSLYKLGDEELAVLIYLSTAGEARSVVDQMEVEEMQEAGGLGRILRLLEDAYGARADERFEERQEAFLTFRRQPGVSVAAYLATLKRLRQEYLKEDAGTVISDKAFAQRMLSRASLTKKERMDIFFPAMCMKTRTGALGRGARAR